MKRIEFMRRSRGLSQRALGEECSPKIQATDICKAERGRYMLYPGQLERLANALGWEGDPAELFEEVREDAIIPA